MLWGRETAIDLDRRQLTHDLLPAQRPIAPALSDQFRIGELDLGDLLRSEDLRARKFRRPIGDVAAARAAEIGERERALYLRLQPEVKKLVGEPLVLRAHRHGSAIEQADDAFLGKEHFEGSSARHVIA